jgi:hypothetical protein
MHKFVHLLVFPKGFEPPSSEPESDILSIELRERNYEQRYNLRSRTKSQESRAKIGI